MSLLKAIKQQLGLSTTPANNFTLDASADNGTMKLARGNAGATTQDILTVGADGRVTAPQGFVGDGTALTGVSILGVPKVPYKTGRYYGNPFATGGSNGFDSTSYSGKIQLIPTVIHTSQLFSHISIYVTTLIAAKTIRLGIYSDNNGVPGSLLYDAGTTSFATTGIKDVVLNQTLPPGYYWLAFITDATATGVCAWSAMTQTGIFGCTDISINYGVSGYYGTQAYGTLPTTLPTLTPVIDSVNGYSPGIYLKAA